MRMFSSRGGRVAPGILALATVTGCSLLMKLGADQCLTDGDCQAKGAPFAGTTCQAGVCVKPNVGGDGGPETGGPTCTTNQQCVEQNGGVPYICKKTTKTCVPIQSEDCKPKDIFGPFENDNAILIGQMDPGSGTQAGALDFYGKPIRLAVSEINRETGGVPNPAGPKRPIVLVACDETADPIRAAHHLVDDLGVPAILGLTRGEIFIKVATEVTTPKKVVLMGSQTQSPSILTTGSLGYQWSVYPNNKWEALAITSFVPRLETITHADANVPAGDLKLSLLVADDSDGRAAGDAIQSSLQFNGKDFAANGSNYQRVKYESIYTTADPKIAPAAAQIVAQAPHIIVTFGGSEDLDVMVLVEQTWNPSVLYRPRWIINDQGVLPQVSQYLQGNAGARQRLFYVKSSADPASATSYAAFKAAYTAENSGEAPFEWQEYPYDAAYMIALAAAASSSTSPSIDGEAIARGLLRLLPKPGLTPRPGGSANIGDLFKSLAVGGEIDLIGASGSLDLDPTDGTPAKNTLNFFVGCYTLDGITVKPTPSGLTYSVATGQMTGTLNCP